MVNWQITLTTVYCDMINDEVTIIVNKDLSARCTACKKPPGVNAGPGQQDDYFADPPACEGPDCRLVTQYRERLLAEERQQATTWE